MKKEIYRKISILLRVLAVAIFLIAGFLVWQRQNPFFRYDVKQIITENISGGHEISALNDSQSPKVIGLKIKSSDISVPVTLANIENNKWDILSDSVAMLSNSQDVESDGIILYGHNWKSLLGNLNKVSLGDSIILEYSNGVEKEFMTTGVAVVKSNNLLSLKSDDLVIYTCAGFLDKDRLIVSAQEI